MMAERPNMSELDAEYIDAHNNLSPTQRLSQSKILYTYPYLRAYLTTLEKQVAAGQAFKDYVHQRLDDAGIPTHPEGEHSAAGCRVGDRLDIALDAQAEQIAEAVASERSRCLDLFDAPVDCGCCVDERSAARRIIQSGGTALR